PGERRSVPFRSAHILFLRLRFAVEWVYNPHTGDAVGAGVFVEYAWNWLHHLIKGIILDDKATIADWFARFKVAIAWTTATGVGHIPDPSSWTGKQASFGTVPYMTRDVAATARPVRAVKMALAAWTVNHAEGAGQQAPAAARSRLMRLQGRQFDDYAT